MNGIIDDVRVYDRALAADEVVAHTHGRAEHAHQAFTDAAGNFKMSAPRCSARRVPHR